MWLCTKYGYFSVKQDAQDRYFIRARVRRDLVNLCDAMQDAFAGDLSDPALVRLAAEIHGHERIDPTAVGEHERYDAAGAIQEWPTADYRFRLIVSGQALGAVFTLLAGSIDYPNFKSEVAKHPDQRRHLHLYHEVWRTMAGLQD